MNVFLKYLLKSALSKKGRSLLLVITITISAALLIGCLGAVEASGKANKAHAERASGEYNVEINVKNVNDTPYFYRNKIPTVGVDTFVSSINIGGYLIKDDNKNITLKGVSTQDYKKLPNMKIIKHGKYMVFNGDNIIISEKTSETNNLKLGDFIEVNARGENKNFKVSAIAATNGVFSEDLKNQFTVVTNEENVCRLWGADGIANTVYVKLKNNIDPNRFIKNYNEKNGDSLAVLTFDEQKVNGDAEQISLLLYFMLILVVFMSCFIIYGCFKLIVIERMPILGTFLSQGETYGGIIKLLLGESLIYGMISGILALPIGSGLLYLLADITNEFKQYGIATKVDYRASYFIAGFVFAIVISLISALIPILAIRKAQVKDIILNNINVSNKESYKLSVFGFSLALAAIIINCIKSSLVVNCSPIIFLIFVAGTVFSVTGVVKILSYYLMKIFQNSNIVFRLAFNNIRTSKILLNNVRLVVMGMISVIIVLSMSYSYREALIGMQEDYSYDISVMQGSDPGRVENIVNKTPNVKKIIKTYFVSNAEIKGTDIKIAVGGIDTDTYENFNNYFVISNKAEFYGDINKKERNLAINDVAAKNINKSKGDSLTLRINNKEATYRITGIFNAKLSPNQILVSKENMMKDFGVTVPDSYNLQINGNPENFKKSLEKQLIGTNAKVTTFDEDFKVAEANFEQIVDILMFFSIMTIIIGLFGIINNVGVSFIQRKKELAVLNSIGMTNKRNGVMIFIESVFTAIYASVLGGIISYAAVQIVGNIFKCIEIDIPMQYDYSAFLMVSIGVFIIMLVSSISIMFKTTKLSVIRELKYE